MTKKLVVPIEYEIEITQFGNSLSDLYAAQEEYVIAAIATYLLAKNEEEALSLDLDIDTIIYIISLNAELVGLSNTISNSVNEKSIWFNKLTVEEIEAAEQLYIDLFQEK